jgi:predicted amidohydrolase YtcJ
MAVYQNINRKKPPISPNTPVILYRAAEQSIPANSLAMDLAGGRGLHP